MPIVRTRIAPSPTGFLHLGTARTALYAWAFARHHGGQFILRIEDTDVARSTDDSVDQILRSMAWLGLAYDEGPYYQMQRLERYHQVAEQLIAAGQAYRCWCTPEQLEVMREAQRARGEKTRYDGTWRPEPGKVLPPVPEGVSPVVRLRNPATGDVAWNDLVKGPISISNEEIDDLILLRPAPAGASAGAAALGVPTYNFAVVVDDWDMRITHVFRGDEHINNTPWQINLYRALDAPLPLFGHFPVILGDDGLKLSKRRGAVSVTAYEEAGYLPEAMLNYLARLGWSHGDDELFSREQMVAWFDGTHLSKSPAQWDPAKLAWVNAHYMKQADDERLARLAQAQLGSRGVRFDDLATLQRATGLFKERSTTVVELADWVAMLVTPVAPAQDELEPMLTPVVVTALRTLRDRLAEVTWDKAALGAAIKQVVTEHGLKMPALAMPLRLLVCGRAQTPSIDAVLELFTREAVLGRLQHV